MRRLRPTTDLSAARAAVLVVMEALVSGCAALPQIGPGSDPLERSNRPVFRFNDAFDDAVLRPVANGYVKVTPEPVRGAVSNFFDNLNGINVTLNSFLQGNLTRGFSDLSRLLVNSTI